MTNPPHDQPSAGASDAPHGWSPAYGTGPETWEHAAPPAPPRRSRRGLVVAASVTGVVLLGGGGYAVAAYLSGGGAQPEDVLPDTTVAFVSLDLDPAAGQKVAVADLLDDFPSLEETPEDLRGSLLDELLAAQGVEADVETDVEPWLGDRMALAAVPSPEAEAGLAPVLALAVEDEQAMTESLDRLRESADFGSAVRDGFVLLALDQATADRAAGAETVLADDSDYSADRAALGGDHVAVAWADLGSVQGYLAEAAGGAGGAAPLPGPMGQELSGRIVLGLHAEEGALELEGLQVGGAELGGLGGGTEPTRLVGELPEDVLLGFSASGLGDGLTEQWSQLEESGALAGVEEQVAGLGIELPDDLRALLGSDTAIAVTGDWESPAFGARVVTDDPDRALEVLDVIVAESGGEVPLFSSPADGGYAVASDQSLADAVAGQGFLGDTDAFRAAAPEAEDAVVAAFVDLRAVIEQLPDSGDEGVQPSDLAAVEALGLTSGMTDEGARFVLRITTSG